MRGGLTERGGGLIIFCNSFIHDYSNYDYCLERFSIECRKTIECRKLPCPITELAGNPINQSELEVNTCSRRQARENACEQVTIGFGFTTDWPRKWREIF